MGYQVHIPLLRSQQCQRHSAKLTIARLQSTVSTESFREPGHKPIPSGHILHGRPINRSVPGRPAIPRTSPGTAQPGRSRRRSPDGPSTQVAPKARNTHGSGVGPHGVGPKAEQVPHRSLRESRAARLTRQWSRGPTRLTVTTSARPSLTSWASTPRPITLGSLCTLSVLTLHVVGKAHIYQHVGSNVPGG